MSTSFLDDLDQMIESSRRMALECDKENYDSYTYSNSAERETERLLCLKEFAQFDVSLKEMGNGLILVNDKYVFALRSFKWRVQGKNTWYKSSGPAQFLMKHLKLKPKESDCG